MSREDVYFENKRIPFAIETIITVGIISALTFFDIRGNARIIGLVLALIVFCFSETREKLKVLFFLAVLTTDIQFDIAGIPYISIMQMIFIITYFWTNKINKRMFLVLSIIASLQLMVTTLFEGNIIDVIVFIVNILITYCVCKIVERKKNIINDCLKYYVAGVLIMLASAIRRIDITDVGKRNRFKAIYTDPNFVGMFCMIAICVLLYFITTNIMRNIILLIPMGFLLWCGFLTYSRSFIFSLVIISAVVIKSVFTEDEWKVPGTVRVLIFFLLALLIITLYNNYGALVLEERSLETIGGDFTNGRTSATMEALNIWGNKTTSILVGVGVSNYSPFYGVATHNTYADIIIFFGVLPASIAILYLVSFLKRKKFHIISLLSIKKSFILIVLFYAATLSLFRTDAVYLLLGLLFI